MGNKDKLEKVTKTIHTLTTKLYNHNRLMVNHGKSQILQVEATKTEATKDDRKIIQITNTDNKILKAQNSMKILGFTLNARGEMDSHLSRIKSRIGMEHHKIKPYLKWMNLNDRKTIVNSKLRSVVDYGLPLFMGENLDIRDKLESTYMTIKRIIHGGLTFRVRKTDICRKIKEETPDKHILKVSTKFIHKHLHHRKCQSLMNELIIPKRSASIIYLKNPLISTYPGSLDRIIQIFNKQPQKVKEK